MLWAVWVALAIGVIAVCVGAARAGRQALGAFRALRRLQREVTPELDAVTRSAERLAARSTDGPAALEPALARFSRSQAQLAVLLAAVQEVRDSVERVTAFYPRK